MKNGKIIGPIVVVRLALDNLKNRRRNGNQLLCARANEYASM